MDGLNGVANTVHFAVAQRGSGGEADSRGAHLVEKRLRTLLSLIDAWLLDREIAKDAVRPNQPLEPTADRSDD